MKKLMFLILICFFAGNLIAQNDTKEFNPTEIFKVIEENSKFDNDIILPIGTTWRYTSTKGNEVNIQLPKGYSFLKLNTNTNIVAEEGSGSGYSCTCGGTGSCTVFYQSKLGYGCLQSTCGGTCTGSAAAFKIVGVINSENRQLSLDKSIPKASLSVDGKHNFLKLTEVQQEIKKNYDFVYANIKKPDFNSINSIGEIPDGYFMAKFYIYGFEVGLLLPKDTAINKLIPELNIGDSPTSCSCSGSQSATNTIIAGCKLEKDCIFGYCAYYCTGCTTCTMR